MLRDILVSYGVLFGSGVFAFLITVAFSRGLRLEQQALQEAYRNLQTLIDEPWQPDLSGHRPIGISA